MLLEMRDVLKSVVTELTVAPTNSHPLVALWSQHRGTPPSPRDHLVKHLLQARCVRYNKMVWGSTVETQLIMWCSIYY